RRVIRLRSSRATRRTSLVSNLCEPSKLTPKRNREGGMTKTEFDRAYVTAHGKVAVLTLNHPEAMNAAGVKLVKGAYAALNFVEDPKNGFRAVVLTGEGRGF